MALHRFIHIGDTHLASVDPRNADRVAALQQITDAVSELSEDETLAAIVWPGDLFDGPSSAEDRNMLQFFLARLTSYAPVVIVEGNHDAPGDLQIFERLRTDYSVILCRAPEVSGFLTATNAIARVFPVPYIYKQGLVAAGVEHAALGQTAADRLDPVFLRAAAELTTDAPVIPFVALHMNVGGAVSSIGQPQIGKEIELTPALVARLPAGVAIMANHIHKHQTVLDRVVYAGSICRMDFGENEPKGFVVWTYDDEARAWSWDFRPLDVPDQLLLTGELTRAGFAPDAPIPPVAGADVKVRYRFLKADAGVLDPDLVKAAVAGARSIRTEGVPALEHSVRAPEIAAAVTLEEKVLRCAALQGVPATDSLVAKLSMLQNQDSARILATLVAADPAAAVMQEVS